MNNSRKNKNLENNVIQYMSRSSENLTPPEYDMIRKEMSLDTRPILYYSVIDNLENISITKNIIPIKVSTFKNKELSLFLYLINDDEILNKLFSFISNTNSEEYIRSYTHFHRTSNTNIDIILYLIMNTIKKMKYYINDQKVKLERDMDFLRSIIENETNTEVIELTDKKWKDLFNMYSEYSKIDFNNHIFLSYIQEVISYIIRTRVLVQRLINLTSTNERLECLNAHKDNFSIPSSNITYLIKKDDMYTTKTNLRVKEELKHLPELNKMSEIIKNSTDDHFEELHSFVLDFLKIGEKYEKTNNSYVILEQYKIDNIIDFINLSLYLISRDNITILKCKNCGKLFIQKTRVTETLCDNIYRNGKTCKELSSVIKLENDEIRKTYRSAYKLEHGKYKRYKSNGYLKIDEKFNNWNEKAKNKMNECENGNITLDEFKNWIKENKEWYRKEVN